MRLIITLFIASQLVACAKVHDLTPIYNGDTKTLTVDNLSIKPVSNYKSKKEYFGDIHGGDRFIKLFKTNDNVCRKILVEQLIPHSNVYLEFSSSERIMAEYNGSCLTRKIGNIQSLRCMDKPDNKVDLYLTSSAYLHDGYGRETTYIFPNNNCLKKFESYFVDKTPPKDVGSYKSNKLKSSQYRLLKNLVK